MVLEEIDAQPRLAGDASDYARSTMSQAGQMERYVVTTRLKPGAAPAAEELLSAGPPFDPGEEGLSAHTAYISSNRVLFVFEGETAHATALQLAKTHVVEVSRWQDIVWELPSVIAEVPADARCLYRWPVNQSDQAGASANPAAYAALANRMVTRNPPGWPAPVLPLD